MTVRTTSSTVTFQLPFRLGDSDEVLAPGTYDVESDEELLEGLSFLAYRKVLTVIHLPVTSEQQGLSRALTIDPKVLEAALERDVAAGATLPERTPGQKPSPGIRKAGASETDRQAEDRAEDEGMIVSRR